MKYTQDLSNSDMCVNIDFIMVPRSPPAATIKLNYN